VYLVAAILAALALQQIWNTSRQTEAIPYSEFEQLVTDKKSPKSSSIHMIEGH